VGTPRGTLTGVSGSDSDVMQEHARKRTPRILVVDGHVDNTPLMREFFAMLALRDRAA